MKAFITKDTPVTEEVLNTIAHLPTKSLSMLVEDEFFRKLTDKDFMRIAFLLAEKGYNEGGCPIGGVIISNDTRLILGKGHNTLVQESHPVQSRKPRQRATLAASISARRRCSRPSALAISARP